MKKYIVVGGVAGGATAAARLRRLDEEAEIILLERGPYISFANCGLPYYIGDVIQDRARLLVQTKEKFHNRFWVDVRTDSEAVALDTDHRKITIRSGGREYVETYDGLILSPGAQPLRPPIPGINGSHIFTLRNVGDADVLRQQADNAAGRGRVVIIGGGFIGVEMAENLQRRGLATTLVEAAPHLLAPFDTDMVKIVERELVQQGIQVVLGDGVEKFESSAQGVYVHLVSGKAVQADFAVLAIGVRPDTAFLKDSGVALTERGYIEVDKYLRTTATSVYAVGDAVQLRRIGSNGKTTVPLAGPANRQGRLAADNMMGMRTPYRGAQGTAVLKVFDMTAAVTGENERALAARGQEYHVVKIYPDNHAGYYPGAVKMALKVLFDPRGRILGAQGAGSGGVDKRIDVIAAMLRQSGTVRDLSDLELAYAPPFSSAKDPVNIAGYAAENVLDGLTDLIPYPKLEEALQQGARLIDVRTADEFANGHLPQAENIPLEELRDHLIEMDTAIPLIVYCQIGQRGYYAERVLRQHGYKVQNLLGGYMGAKDEQFVVDSSMPPLVIRKKVAPPEAAPGVPVAAAEAAAEDAQGDAPRETCRVFDLTGLSCPGPLMKLKEHLEKMNNGETARFTASDPGFYSDSQAWCERTGHQLLKRERKQGLVSVWIRKGKAEAATTAAPIVATAAPLAAAPAKDDKTIIVFSGDLDKVLASFVIANGALAMGKKVTMFFTFWGLNVLRRPDPVPVEKNLIDRMFGWMMPKGSENLKLSNMNMMGLGTKMMRQVMKDKNITSLESLIQSARDSGVRMIACQMSMDVMGIRREELIDGVEIGGVGTFLGAADDANMSLFI